MKCTSTVAFAILSFASSISAFPAQEEVPYYYPATNNVYRSSTSEVDFDSQYGNMTRTPGTNDELSTLVVFQINSQASNGKMCEFSFWLGNDAEHSIEGDAKFDVFWSTSAVTNDGVSSNFRGAPLGRMVPVDGGEAKTYSGGMWFLCPEANAGFDWQLEVVPASDNMNMAWSKTGGPWIKYY